jgi:hypothetical protein
LFDLNPLKYFHKESCALLFEKDYGGESGRLELELHGARNLKVQKIEFRFFKENQKNTMV